jgi:acyl-CoA dehydrogenase
MPDGLDNQRTSAHPPAVKAAASYLVDSRELSFFLWELFEIDKEFLGRAPFGDLDRSAIERQLVDARSFAAKLASCNAEADRNGAHLAPDGSVVIPGAYRELWDEWQRDWQWLRHSAAQDRPGRVPPIVTQILFELFLGANASFTTYGGFTLSAVRLLQRHATDRQKQLLLGPLLSERWDATFCATEAQAGSDLSAVETSGEPIGGDVYSIAGHKKYITAGMHPLTENTIYLVVGRLKGASSNPFKLSCFLVPRYWLEADGSLGPNNVECVHVEDKMGFNGCANTHLVFGGRGATRGFLLGNRPHIALLQLDLLMKAARAASGQIGVAMASSAYLHSVRYARSRVQGRRFTESSNAAAPRVAIIEHADVQRMLLEMKAKVEGCRGLVGKAAFHASKALQLLAQQPVDDSALNRHVKMALLYTPIIKAYGSDEAWRVATLALQVHGGAGYLRDRPLEQYARDIKVLSIWEGTNYVQSQDLLRDKLGFGRQSLLMRYFESDLRGFLSRRDEFPPFAGEFSALSAALDELLGTLDRVRQLADAGRFLEISQFCTRFLEMFGEVILGWVLMEAGCIAAKRLAALPAGDADRPFYEGKVKTARFFIYNILPGVAAKAEILRHCDHSFIEVDEAEFGFTGDAADAVPAPPAAATPRCSENDGAGGAAVNRGGA